MSEPLGAGTSVKFGPTGDFTHNPKVVPRRNRSIFSNHMGNSRTR
jgi:hypothetical protein